jgi:hypothetical protein
MRVVTGDVWTLPADTLPILVDPLSSVQVGKSLSSHAEQILDDGIIESLVNSDRFEIRSIAECGRDLMRLSIKCHGQARAYRDDESKLCRTI